MRRLSMCLLLCAASASAAERGRVAVLVDDVVLEHAIATALQPWDLEVLPLHEVRPSPALPQAASQAERIAADAHAAAVIWVTGDGPDSALWVFDAETQQLIARRVEFTAPIDPAVAAAMALSAKTLLRLSTVAPPVERLAPPPSPRTQLRLEAQLVGFQAQFGDPKGAELRFGAALAWYPKQLGRHLGLALAVSGGLGADVGPLILGKLSDLTLGLQLRSLVPLGRVWDVEPYLGASLHLITLDGSARALSVSQKHDDPSLDLGIAVDLHLGASVHVGVVVGLAWLLTYQHYYVGGVSAVNPFPVELTGALRFTAGVL